MEELKKKIEEMLNQYHYDGEGCCGIFRKKECDCGVSEAVDALCQLVEERDQAKWQELVDWIEDDRIQENEAIGEGFVYSKDLLAAIARIRGGKNE